MCVYLVHFKDIPVQEEILSSNDPRKHKAYGRKVADYDQKEWDIHGPNYMKEGIKAKVLAVM
jgi:predicted NAD-dependent protein-ADP-ribosyltransferase YbiA (DUF1768 family)